MENGRSCEDFLNMQRHQAISDNKIVNSAIPCCVLIFWHWRAHYLSMRLGWCQPAPLHHGEEGVREGLLQHMPLLSKGQEKGVHSRLYKAQKEAGGELRGNEEESGRGERPGGNAGEN